MPMQPSPCSETSRPCAPSFRPASSGVLGLPEEGARRLLEDAAPGPGPLLLALEVADHLAHPRGRDLDPMLRAYRAEAVVILGQLERDRLEAVPGNFDPLGEVHDVRVEHQLVVRVGLDQDDVDAGVLFLPLANRLVEALVGEQLEGLVAE